MCYRFHITSYVQMLSHFYSLFNNIITCTSHLILSYLILSYLILCYVMLCYVMLCYVMLCYVMLCYLILSYPILCYVMLCYVMICHVILSYLILSYLILSYLILSPTCRHIMKWFSFLFQYVITSCHLLTDSSPDMSRNSKHCLPSISAFMTAEVPFSFKPASRRFRYTNEGYKHVF